MKLLDATANQFRGMIIDPALLPGDPEEFRQRLGHSLLAWQQEEMQLVWLEVPIHKSALIPVAVEAGFTFHHTSEAYLMMTYQVHPEAFIPGYATHYIGAGGVVINDNEELLVVSERHRRNRDRPFYKLPGGALHPGEHLADAVIREVLEETGVQTKFESLACFRHWHGYRYGKSDIYFICRLSPISLEIVIQEEEIEESIWMPIQEYLSNEYVATFNKEIVRASITSPGLTITEIEGYSDPELREFFMPRLGD